jgi:hypothetical protein
LAGVVNWAVARYLRRMNVQTPKPNKYKAYRERKKAAGLKQVRIWTLDTSVPGFQERLDSAFERERHSPEMQSLNDACDANAAEVWRDLP